MLELAKRGSAGTASGVDALLSAVVFGGLAVLLPAFGSFTQASLTHVSAASWQHLNAANLDGVGALLGQTLRPLLLALCALLGLCGLGGLAAWRFRAVLPEGPGLTADDAPFQLLAGVVWLVGTTALLPRWLELSGVATDAYPALLLSALRGLLWLCTMAAILRAVLSLRR